MTGTVVTFYSYKGGVGRSFALANVAVLLARWGKRVLTIDWDLEAPGLHHYFNQLLPTEPDGGVVDLVDDFDAGEQRPRDRTLTLDIEKGRLSLLAAGRQDDTYASRVQAIDWDGLYQRGFARFLEACRAEWIDDYDFVLIDSRTGISDIGSICTAQLPDSLVVLFTANEQSIQGAVDIAGLADRARDRLPYDRPRHLVLPILSRLDNRVEYERAESWQRRCAELAKPLFGNWLAKSLSEELMLRHVTLPYVSYWSFGEQLPVLEEPTPSADQVSFALETVAAVIAHGFDRTDLLGDSRDAYVAAARSKRRDYDLDVLVSCPRSALGTAAELVAELAELDVAAARSVSADVDFFDQATEPARHLWLIVDRAVSRWQTTEADRFLRNTLDNAADDRQLFCVLTHDTDAKWLPAFLRNLRYLRLDENFEPRQVARQLRDFMTNTPSRRVDVSKNTLLDAASALRNVPHELAHSGRWALIDQTVEDMRAAMDDGDMARLQDLTIDLELLGQVRANGTRFSMPDDLQPKITDLLVRIERRIDLFTE